MKRTTITIATALLVAAAGLSYLAAQAPVMTVLSRDGRKPLPVTVINNQEYLFVDDINSTFGTASKEDRLAGGLTIAARGQLIVLTADQNVVAVQGRLVSLPAPVLRRDNRWLVPVDFLTRALSSAIATRIDYRRGVRLLIVGEMRVPRVVARVDAGTTNVAVTFEVTPNTEARVVPQQGRLVVQFEADALELSVPLLPQQNFLTALAPGDTPSSVAITLGPRYASHRVITTPADAGSGRVTIDLLPATTEAAPTPAPSPAPDTRLVIPTQVRQRDCAPS